MLSVFPDLIKTFAGENCYADVDVGDALIDSVHVSSSKCSSNNYKESNQTFHSMGRIFHYIIALVNMEGPNTMYQEQTHFITADIHIIISVRVQEHVNVMFLFNRLRYGYVTSTKILVSLRPLI